MQCSIIVHGDGINTTVRSHDFGILMRISNFVWRIKNLADLISMEACRSTKKAKVNNPRKYPAMYVVFDTSGL